MVQLNALLKTKGPNAGSYMHRCPTLGYRADSTWDDEKKTDPMFLGKHNSILELISPAVHSKALDRSNEMRASWYRAHTKREASISHQIDSEGRETIKVMCIIARQLPVLH